MVAADADVGARMDLGAALPHDDRARAHQLPAVTLDAETLRLRVAAVARAAACFLVCHDGFLFLDWLVGALGARKFRGSGSRFSSADDPDCCGSACAG